MPAIVRRIIVLCERFLHDAGKTRDAAALCLGRLLTRYFVYTQSAIVLFSFLRFDCVLRFAFSYKPRFFLRPDLVQVALPEFLSWACDVLGSDSADQFVVAGALASLVAILTHGARLELLPLLHRIRDIPERCVGCCVVFEARAVLS